MIHFIDLEEGVVNAQGIQHLLDVETVSRGAQAEENYVC